uniref:Glycoprotein hormone-like secreted protein n=1 Tax=Tripedalia cystophora TaxID=6141 RepID=A0A481ZQI0_TRICY|nr:glycoprotein hormone-like secreted protein [Tripedalia cystophora]
MIFKRVLVALACLFLTTSVTAKLSIDVHRQVCKPIQFSAVPVKMPGCTLRKVPFNQCVGTCLSVDGYPGSLGKRLCKCCQPVMWRRRDIELECLHPSNGSRVIGKYTVREAVACACTPCIDHKK